MKLGSDTKTLIIAEAGVNHNGDINRAKDLVICAKDAGADIVKFQTFKAEYGTSKFAEKAPYQKENTTVKESQLSMLKKLELTYDEFTELKYFCDDVGIQFLSTSSECESIDFLDNLGIEIFKISSGHVTHLPYLRLIAAKNKPVILSTGMATMDEIKASIDALYCAGLNSDQLSLLQCTTDYPAPYNEANLRAMNTLKETFNLPVGFSDHSLGITLPIAAVAMGATIIEKHFTLDKTLDGPDHKASLDPDELKEMVTQIRCVESALGSGVKAPTPSELRNRPIARKSIVAKYRVSQGETFTEYNLICKRPGTGISPMEWDNIIGTIATKSYEEDELIEKE
tara:strand:- start:668 stop:1690 length:1023 start_codon:yes stop_codon:yes gene_type:complete